MKIGVTFPQTEIGSDPIVIRDYAQAAESLGYDHILAYDHVIGADASVRPDWGGRYTSESAFHEPFVLFGYLGGLTTRIEFATGILILPQRQTVLVAKQAAAVDVLTNGRLQLGIGLGWNEVEYEALNEDFHNRGRRAEEQIDLMRRLWTDEIVEFKGKWHTVDRAGLNPMPVQRPIPVFMGGSHEAVLERAARIADGWFPIIMNAEAAAALPARVKGLLDRVRANGRDPDAFELRVQTSFGRPGDAEKTPDDWQKELQFYSDLGFSKICVSTMGLGFKQRDHIDAIRKYMDAVGSLAR